MSQCGCGCEAPASSLERLAKTSPDLEIWFDSSPLIFEAWKKELLDKAGEGKKRALQQQLARLYRYDDPKASVMVGVTTNPPLSKQAVDKDPEGCNVWIDEIVRTMPSASLEETFWVVYKEVVKRGAQLYHPIFEASGYKRGYISGQVDPRVLKDTQTMVSMGKDLNGMMRNVMVKMPGTAEGIEGIRILTSMGIPTNATLTFALSQLVAVAEAVKAGLKEAKDRGTDLSKWRSVVTMMLGRFEDSKGMMDGAKDAGVALSPEELRWAGIAVFKKAYQLFKERGYQSKMLAASMRTGPQVQGRDRVWHVEKMGGGNVVLTIFPNIMEAFLQCYEGEDLPVAMEEGVPADVLSKLVKIPYFRQGYEEDGLSPDEFIHYCPVQETAQSFAEATDQFEQHVASRRKAVLGR